MPRPYGRSYDWLKKHYPKVLSTTVTLRPSIQQKKEIMSTATESKPETKPEAKLQSLIASNPYDRISDVAGFVQLMGQAVYESTFFGCTNVAQGRVIALDCLVRKIPILERAATDHIVKGKLSMRADAMLAEFLRRGGKVKWLAQGDDGQEAKAAFTTRESQKLEVSYTIEQARHAGLIKKDSGWDKDPGAMLRARLISKAVRMLDPEAIAGRYTPEELDPASVGTVEGAEYVPVENTEGHKPVEFPGAGSATSNDAANATAPVTEQPTTSAPVAAEYATTATVEATVETSSRNEEMITQAQLERMAELKNKLGLTSEQWKAVVAKRGVDTAKKLTHVQARDLIGNLERKASDREAEAWANNVLEGGPGGAASGATTEAGAEEPPFEAPSQD